MPIFETKDGSMAPNESFVQQVQQAIPEKSTPLLVACKVGPRSKQAADLLASIGYDDIIEVTTALDTLHQAFPFAQLSTDASCTG